jgi:hypothetical protein
MRVHRNCCGLDVHKETIAACLISESEDGTSSRQKRIFVADRINLARCTRGVFIIEGVPVSSGPGLVRISSRKLRPGPARRLVRYLAPPCSDIALSRPRVATSRTNLRSSSVFDFPDALAPTSTLKARSSRFNSSKFLKFQARTLSMNICGSL